MIVARRFERYLITPENEARTSERASVVRRPWRLLILLDDESARKTRAGIGRPPRTRREGGGPSLVRREDKTRDFVALEARS